MPIKIKYGILLLFALLPVALSEALAQNQSSLIVPQSEKDSINLLIRQCDSDTCRFRIFQSYFWKYADYDMNRVKTNRANRHTEKSRNSNNLQRRADGYDIKGFLYENDKKI